MNCSTLGFPIFPEFAQTQVHGVGDAIQPSPPLLLPSSSVLILSQHQRLSFRCPTSSFQFILRTDALGALIHVFDPSLILDFL